MGILFALAYAAIAVVDGLILIRISLGPDVVVSNGVEVELGLWKVAIGILGAGCVLLGAYGLWRREHCFTFGRGLGLTVFIIGLLATGGAYYLAAHRADLLIFPFSNEALLLPGLFAIAALYGLCSAHFNWRK